ncbi:MAG: anaerobic ribonucleoside-triphosphate reductase activating protein [Spirochaetales bacterium]|nr:anaerobic ribonucleoside-triphosphate reductase activating protein [Spirochaetales bacterium]
MSEKLYGFLKTTLIDYPGKVASTIFTRGCNLRCPYCHNPDFVNGVETSELITWQEIMNYLKKRSNLLGGVCITGGEPLIHNDIAEKISDIHSIGLPVKIDTNGTLPDKLRTLKVDYIAMDIKTSLDNYKNLGYTGNDSELAGRITESIRYIKESGIAHHFRTTVAPGFINKNIINSIINLIQDEKYYVLQGYRAGATLDPAYSEKTPYPPSELIEMQSMFIKAGIECNLINNG